MDPRQKRKWGEGLTPIGNDLDLDDMQSWITLMAIKGAKDGLREDGSWVRRKEEGAPSRAPSCPDHPNTATKWRGPMPGRADAPIVVDSKGYETIVVPHQDEPRNREASRLWRIADTYADGPCPLGDDHHIWQAAPCVDCLDARQKLWLDEMWPPPPEKRARGAEPAHGDGDWEL